MRKLFALSVIIAAVAALAPLNLQAEEETPLGEQMDHMKAEVKVLRSALENPSDADKDKYVDAISKFIAAATKSKKFDPAKTETLPEADRAAFVKEYRAGMNKLIKAAEGLKESLAAGKWDDARAQLKELGKIQKAGHKEFRIHKD